MSKLKTREQVLQDFRFRGVTITRWAREHGLNEAMTYQVLYGKKKGVRGEAHRVAVALGLKHGIACPPITKKSEGTP
jgi:gp16 family phage-associated protein